MHWFVCFLGEFEDTDMSFRNYLTFTQFVMDELVKQTPLWRLSFDLRSKKSWALTLFFIKRFNYCPFALSVCLSVRRCTYVVHSTHTKVELFPMRSFQSHTYLPGKKKLYWKIIQDPQALSVHPTIHVLSSSSKIIREQKTWIYSLTINREYHEENLTRGIR